MKACISRVELKPHVVNPLTVAGNKAKLRLVLEISSETKLLLSLADLLLSNDMFTGRVLNGNL
jgi:hypothetical protein